MGGIVEPLNFRSTHIKIDYLGFQGTNTKFEYIKLLTNLNKTKVGKYFINGLNKF